MVSRRMRGATRKRTTGTISPNLRREMRKQVAPSTIGDALHSSIPLSSTGELLNVDSGASDHFTPSRGDLGAYKKFAKPVEISVMVLGPCEWQRQPTV